MKNFNKTLLVSAIVAGLAGCTDDYKPEDTSFNNAPVHGGDIEVTLSEKDAGTYLHLLGSIKGEYGEGNTGEGVVIDYESDPVFIQNVTTKITDSTLGELSETVGHKLVSGVQVGVAPMMLMDELDSGQTRTIEYNYEISDGKKSTSRKMTINIEGEDFAPVFVDSKTSHRTSQSSVVVDLLEGVVDEDGETLFITDVTVDSDKAIYTMSGSTLTLDVDATTAGLAVGAEETYVFTYKVNDHNNALTRTSTFILRNVLTEPRAPEVVKNYEAVVNTNDSIQYVDLSGVDYIIDWNGDTINIDLSNISAVGDAPALKFNKSSGATLAVDPIDFSSYLTAGETKTFTYTYPVDDGAAATEGQGGHNVDVNFSVTVTKATPVNLIANGGFETGDLTGWTVNDDTLINVQAVGDAFEGGHMLVSTAADSTASTSFNVEANAGYYVRQTDRSTLAAGVWAGSYSAVLDDKARPFNFHPSYNADNIAQPWSDYKYQASSFTATENGSKTITYTVSAIELDSVFAYKYSTDPANNLVMQAGQNSVDFEDGTVGSWSGSFAVTTDADQILSGTTSAVVSAWGGTLALPAGTLKNDKKYLLAFDARHSAFDGDGQSPIRVDIETADGASSVLGSPISTKAFPRGRNIIKVGLGETFREERFIDTAKFNDVADWDTKAVRINISPSSWTGKGELIIDNVMLVEVE
ncbi:hypothetical protein [Algibacillus agarilyticus]|uniref:hypothetical protein n=1 Tax=Algibacillus agarilyticus TaxID=2234133 RepID=UPI000DCFB2D7|nr:hypothetical protein [Algibacillus agarilyticus]